MPAESLRRTYGYIIARIQGHHSPIEVIKQILILSLIHQKSFKFLHSRHRAVFFKQTCAHGKIVFMYGESNNRQQTACLS